MEVVVHQIGEKSKKVAQLLVYKKITYNLIKLNSSVIFPHLASRYITIFYVFVGVPSSC